MNAHDERVCISYKHCDTITSRPDCRQNADNVCIGSSTNKQKSIHLTTRPAEKRVSSIHFRRVSIAYLSFYSCNCPGCEFSVLFRYAHGVVDSSLCVLCYSTNPQPRVMFSCSNTHQQYPIYKSLNLPQSMNLRRMSNISMFQEP